MLERIKKRTKNKEKKVSSYYSVSRLVLILRMKKLLCFEKNKNFLPNTSKENSVSWIYLTLQHKLLLWWNTLWKNKLLNHGITNCT